MVRWACAVALAGGLVAWVVGLGVIQSMLVGALAAAATSLLLAPVDAFPVLPGPPSESPSSYRFEVSRLVWAVRGRSHHASDLTMRRLRASAALRLGEAGIDIDDPSQAASAERLLGTFAYSVIVGGVSGRIRHRQVAQCVEAVEGLGRLRNAGIANRRSRSQERQQ